VRASESSPSRFGVEALTEQMFRVTDENPKSVNRGAPLGSIRTFDCLSNSAGAEGRRGETERSHSLGPRGLLRWSASD
jgi:hypothetical protein